MNRLTTEEFIKKAKLIHHNKYDYSLTKYISSKAKVKIICPVHGVFEQLPNDHLNKHGCIKCSKKHRLTTEEFIKRCNFIHHNKYDYRLVNYINKETKVKIICPVHGVFEQIANVHMNGHNCPKCAKHEAIYKNKKLNTISKTTEEFIKEANLIHHNKYNYSLTNYINKKTKVKIICPAHGMFEQIPYVHLMSCGCPVCNKSKGEKIIENLLKENNIYYISQKKFSDLKDKTFLSYDFYIPSKNLLVEYNGKQHYSKKSFNKTYKQFLIQKHHDWMKRQYALKNNYNYLIISYNDNISLKLKKLIQGET